jgi:hypothetical protein
MAFEPAPPPPPDSVTPPLRGERAEADDGARESARLKLWSFVNGGEPGALTWSEARALLKAWRDNQPSLQRSIEQMERGEVTDITPRSTEHGDSSKTFNAEECESGGGVFDYRAETINLNMLRHKAVVERDAAREEAAFARASAALNAEETRRLTLKAQELERICRGYEVIHEAVLENFNDLHARREAISDWWPEVQRAMAPIIVDPRPAPPAVVDYFRRLEGLPIKDEV